MSTTRVRIDNVTLTTYGGAMPDPGRDRCWAQLTDETARQTLEMPLYAFAELVTAIVSKIDRAYPIEPIDVRTAIMAMPEVD